MPELGITKQFRVAALPTARDLSALVFREWKPGRQYNATQYVVVDGHPWVAKSIHTASANNRPGSVAGADVWEQALWQNTHYYVGDAAASTHALTTNDAVPQVTEIGPEPVESGGGGEG